MALGSCSCKRVVRGCDVTVNRIDITLGWWRNDWVLSWFVFGYVSCKEDCLCFLDRGLGSGDLGRSWMGCTGGGGFSTYSCFGGAFEAVGVDASANFSHSRIEHLGALGAFCLGGIGR